MNTLVSLKGHQVLQCYYFTRAIADAKSHAYEIADPSTVRENKERLRFTMDEECNICSPYADCKRQNDLISVPNGDAGATISFLQTQHRSTGLDIHAKHYQQRCEGHSKGGEHLEEKKEEQGGNRLAFLRNLKCIREFDSRIEERSRS
jgi:hypothetical protein